MGPDSAGSAETTGDPRGAWSAAAALTALTRGPGGVAQRRGSSRPAAATARAATHHAAALMAGPGGPGSARFRSARSGRAGVREAAAEQKGEPDAEPEQPSGTTPELDPARSRRCACALPAAPPGASGRRFWRRLRRSRPTLNFQKLGGSWKSGSSVYSKTSKRRFPEKSGPEEKLGAYGAPRGPRRVAM